MDSGGAVAALKRLQEGLKSFGAKGAESLVTFSKKAEDSIGRAFGILDLFISKTKKPIAFGKETKLFGKFREELYQFSEEARAVLSKTFTDISAKGLGRLRAVAPLEKGERKIFKSIPEDAMMKVAAQDYGKVQAQYEKLVDDIIKGNVSLKQGEVILASIVTQLNSVSTYWNTITGYLKEVQNYEKRVNAELTLNSTITNQVLKNKRQWVSVAGVLINTNTKVFKQYGDMGIKVKELQKDEENINKLYRGQITLQKEVLDYLIRNKKPLSEIEIQKNRIIALEKQHLSALDKVRVKAMDINKVLSKGDAYVAILKKQKEQEEKITIQYTARKEAARALLAENKNLIAVAGVAIEKTNEIYVKHKNIQQAVEELKHAEEKINVVYDKLISQQRKAVELMIKQHKSPKIIEAASQRILYLEKQRTRELDKITMEMTKIQKLMVSGASGKEAKAMAHNLKLVAIEAHKTAKSVSSLGLSSNLASKNIIRMGGATTGVFRIFSRWRNRILVATFALAGLIRSMQRFVKIAAETQKETAALETVAFNTGTSVKKVTNAVGELAKDGIFSISAITQSLKGLISMGISVDMAVQAIDTFKDSILANGKATLSMDEALTSGIQGLKEFRSQVSDNLGVMKNLDQILKENPDLVKKYGQSTALLIGFMKEAAQFEGARVKVLGMLSGKMMTLTQKIFMTKKAMGEMISPIAHELINMVMKYTAAVREFVEENAHIIRAYAKDAGETIVNTIEFIKQLGSAIVTLTKDIGFIVFGTIKWLSKISEVRIAGWSVVKILIMMALNFRILTSVLKMFGVVSHKVWFATIGKGVISATKSLFVFNAGLIKTRVSFAFLKTSMITGMAQIKAAAIALSVALKAAFPALLGIAAVMAAILLVEKYISKLTEVAQKKKEMVALDEERARLAKSIMLDTEELSKVLSQVKSLKRLNELTKIVQDASSELEKMGVSTIHVENIIKGFDLSKIRELEDTIINATIAREDELESQKETIEYLKKMGVEYNELTGIIRIVTTAGKELFKVSAKEAEIWLDTMLEFEGKMTGLTRLRESAMKTAAKTEELLAEAISKRQEISQIKTETELIKFYNTYIEKTKDATDAALDYFNQIEDIETQMVNIKNFRDVSMGKLKKEAKQVIELTGDYKKLTKELKEVKEKYILAGTYEDIASQKDIKARKIAIEGIIKTIEGLSDEAKAVIKQSDRYDMLSENLEEIKEKYKGLTEVLKAWGEVLDAQVLTHLLKVNEELEKYSEAKGVSLKVLKEEIYMLKTQRAILKEGANVAQMNLELNIRKENFAYQAELLKSQADFALKVKETSREYEGLINALEKMDEHDVRRKEVKAEILALEIKLGKYDDEALFSAVALRDEMQEINEVMKERERIAGLAKYDYLHKPDEFDANLVKSLQKIADEGFGGVFETITEGFSNKAYSGLADAFAQLSRSGKVFMDLEHDAIYLTTAIERSRAEVMEFSNKTDAASQRGLKISTESLNKWEKKYEITMHNIEVYRTKLTDKDKQLMADYRHEMAVLEKGWTSKPLQEYSNMIQEVIQKSKALGVNLDDLNIDTQFDDSADYLDKMIGNFNIIIERLSNINTLESQQLLYEILLNKAHFERIELMKEQVKVSQQQGAERLIEDLRARRGAGLSTMDLIFGKKGEQISRQERLNEIDKFLKDTVNIKEQVRKDLEVEQHYLLTGTSDFWFKYGVAIKEGMSLIGNTLNNYLMQQQQITSQLRANEKQQLAEFKQNNDIRILGTEEYTRREKILQDQLDIQRKIAYKQQEQELWQHIQTKMQMWAFELTAKAAILGLEKMAGKKSTEVASAEQASAIRVGSAITETSIRMAANAADLTTAQAITAIKAVGLPIEQASNAASLATENVKAIIKTESSALSLQNDMIGAQATINAAMVKVEAAQAAAALDSMSGGLGGIAGFLTGPWGMAIMAIGSGIMAYASYKKQQELSEKIANLQIGTSDFGDMGAGTTVAGPQAQTFGSTIQGQPMNITINPSITIQGELIGIGANGVQELREGLVPLIISAITDAAADGEFDNIVMGSA